MKCPQCNSEKVQKLSVLHELGKLGERPSGHAVDAGMDMKISDCAELRDRVVPPARSFIKENPKAKSGFLGLLLIIVALFAVGVYVEMMTGKMTLFEAVITISLSSFFFFYAGFIIFIIFLMYYAIQDRKKFERAYEHWINSWYCHECDNLYHRQGSA